MATLGVRWGSTPDISGSMQSLGASLAGAVSSNPNSKAARDAAYIESLNHHNQVYDNQAAKIAAETAAKQQELDFANQQQGRAQTAALSQAAAEEQRRGLRAPKGIGVLAPNDPAIVEYAAPANALRDNYSYAYGNGDGNPEQRAKAVQSFQPVPVETKPIFNTQHTQRLVPDANEPSGYKSVAVGGIPKDAAGAGAKPTAENLKAGGFVPRLEHSNEIINKPGVGAAAHNLRDVALDYLPFGMGRGLQSEEYKSLQDAESDMVTAILRDESGATIGDSEFARDKEKYFPRYSDGPEQLREKAERRAIQIEAMKKKAGPALQESAPSGGVTTLEPGHIEDGHRYVGGDPASPSSWEPL